MDRLLGNSALGNSEGQSKFLASYPSARFVGSNIPILGRINHRDTGTGAADARKHIAGDEREVAEALAARYRERIVVADLHAFVGAEEARQYIVAWFRLRKWSLRCRAVPGGKHCSRQWRGAQAQLLQKRDLRLLIVTLPKPG